MTIICGGMCRTESTCASPGLMLGGAVKENGSSRLAAGTGAGGQHGVDKDWARWRKHRSEALAFQRSTKDLFHSTAFTIQSHFHPKPL